MAFAHGKDSRVLMNDVHMSAELSGWSASWTRKLADTTSLADSGFKGTPGLNEGALNADGFFNSSAVSKPFYDTVQASVGVDNSLNVTIWPVNGIIGAPAIFGTTDVSNLEVESAVDDAVKVKFEGAGDGGIDFGVVQQGASTETVSSNSSSVDNTAATSNGGAAMLHVIAASGTGPSLIVKIQHSVDNSVWVDLITFTTVTTTTTSERVELAAGTTVNRYTRNSSTIAGTSPSYTYGTAFARR